MKKSDDYYKGQRRCIAFVFLFLIENSNKSGQFLYVRIKDNMTSIVELFITKESSRLTTSRLFLYVRIQHPIVEESSRLFLKC